MSTSLEPQLSKPELSPSLRGKKLTPVTTNQASNDIPFQQWYNFKEAFSLSFVEDIIAGMPYGVQHCLDPFAGCGTSALTCQFLGVYPTTIEVNPFLADLTEAKLASYVIDELSADRDELARTLDTVRVTAGELASAFPEAPNTLVEPGEKGRWIFNADVGKRILAYRRAIESVSNPSHQRLFRVLLGSVLIPVSNVVISGKGRRYRGSWKERKVEPDTVDELFESAFQRASKDIAEYSVRACTEYTLLRGDSRERILEVEPADLVLFSPPYPNSFDYTDIYNVELWTLGYLQNRADNRTLRESTFRSHLQIKRAFANSDFGSRTLSETLRELNAAKDKLWDHNIPEMLSSYVADLICILRGARAILRPQGQIVMVVGNSRYAGVLLDVPSIIAELAPGVGLECVESLEVREMRSSPQHGGRFDLGEWLIRLMPAL